MDVGEGDRLWADGRGGAADEWAVRSVQCGYDKGLSAFGHSHRVVASAVWEPRVAAEERWVRRAVNGWAVAPVFTEVSGRPYSYDIFGGTCLSGGRESINGSGGAV